MHVIFSVERDFFLCFKVSIIIMKIFYHILNALTFYEFYFYISFNSCIFCQQKSIIVFIDLAWMQFLFYYRFVMRSYLYEENIVLMLSVLFSVSAWLADKIYLI